MLGNYFCLQLDHKVIYKNMRNPEVGHMSIYRNPMFLKKPTYLSVVSESCKR